MKALTKGEILAADDIKREFVSVPEWASNGEDVGVYVRVMSGTARDRFEADNLRWTGEGKNKKAEPNLTNYSARLAALTVCDEAGELLFSAEDLAALAAKSGGALERIVKVAMRLNGLLRESLEEEVGNSSSAPTSSSTTA